MSRHVQNMVVGALAFAVAIVGMVAVTLLAFNDDADQTTTAGQSFAAAGDLLPASSDAEANDGIDTSLTSPPLPMDGAVDPSAPTATQAVPSAPSSLAPRVLAVPAAGESPSSTTPTTMASSSTTNGPTTTTEAIAALSSSTSAAALTTTTLAAEAATSSSATTTVTAGETTTTAAVTTTTAANVTSVTAPTTTTTAPPDTSPQTQPPSAGSLNEVEREIARLTNELRTNPNGQMRRQKPVIDCGGRVRLNKSGGYEPIPAVEISEVASLQVSRPWSAQMSRDNFEHQPNAGVGALQAAGISVRSAGENIAWHNYPNDIALRHFVGWRESDGHFCNMMDPGFTHLGVGEASRGRETSATQNFFSTR